MKNEPAKSEAARVFLRSQDLLVLLKLTVWGEHPWRQEDIARELGLVQSQVNTSLRRAAEAGLYDAETKQVNKTALANLLINGIRHLIPGKLGARAHGLPTAWGHRGAFHALVYGAAEPPVWDSAGKESKAKDQETDGVAVEPLHERVPYAAARDAKLYEILAAIDALRVGRAREMEMARDLLRNRLA